MQSKKDLYQIGEVARLFHLSISLLRHYDKTGLVTPEYTDPDTGSAGIGHAFGRDRGFSP